MYFLLAAAQIIISYFLVDLISSIYHLLTDNGINIKSEVDEFQNHHRNPKTVTLDFRPAIIGIPSIILGLFYFPFFFISFGIFACLLNVPHFWAHFPEKTPKWASFLQKYKIILPPEIHLKGHHIFFDRNYSVFNGWANGIVNWIANKFFK